MYYYNLYIRIFPCLSVCHFEKGCKLLANFITNLLLIKYKYKNLFMCHIRVRYNINMVTTFTFMVVNAINILLMS